MLHRFTLKVSMDSSFHPYFGSMIPSVFIA